MSEPVQDRSVPVAVIYSFFVEHYVAGLTAGAVKG